MTGSKEVAAVDLLQRKSRIGKRASFRKIAEKAGYSHVIIQRVLKGQPTPFPVDRQAILRKTEKALLQIELESLEESEA